MSYMVGVDVSHNNGAINWQKLKATGKLQFAVIRICHGLSNDRQFAANLSACKTLKIPYAFYWYAETATESGAKREAAFALSKIKGTNPLFVAYDAECGSLAALGKNQTTDVAWAACEAIQRAGYKAYIYTNENWRRNEIDVQFLKNKGVGFWYARYTGQTPPTASYASLCDIWQYSCTGKLAGNGSQYIDLDVCYNAGLIAKCAQGTGGVDPNYCDTPAKLTVRLGKTYQFKTGSPIKSGNVKIFKQVSTLRQGGYYFTKFQAVGKGCAGFYMGPRRVTIGTVV